MVSVLIDSSTYGKIIEDQKFGEDLVKEILKNKNKFIVHNFRVIRNELRRAPKPVLNIYNQIVSKRIIQDSKKIKDLAQKYHKEYKKNGGGKGKRKMLNDFKIVACASIKNCDLVFSDDESSLKHKNSIKAYREVNLKEGYRTPTFYSYSDLRKRFLIK